MISARKPDQCTGCRICELICNFHHRKAFGFQSSSIRMLSGEEGKRILKLRREPEGDSPACDGCRKEKDILCARYCPNEVLGNEGGAL